MTEEAATDTGSRSTPSGSITACVLDEDTRRYYLEMMGIQCWQSLEPEQDQAAPDHAETGATVEPPGSSGLATTEVLVADTRVESLAIDWPSLESQIQNCESCALHTGRRQAIVGRGNPAANLMFILLAPETQDDEAGQICSGEADVLFTKMLAAIGISIQDVYITSLLKCSVPQNHTIAPREISLCTEHLRQQVALVQPKRVIVLGETAIQCLLQKAESIDHFRAEINGVTDAVSTMNPLGSMPLFVSYSPRELLQDAGLKRNAWSDLQQLQKLI